MVEPKKTRKHLEKAYISCGSIGRHLPNLQLLVVYVGFGISTTGNDRHDWSGEQRNDNVHNNWIAEDRRDETREGRVVKFINKDKQKMEKEAGSVQRPCGSQWLDQIPLWLIQPKSLKSPQYGS